MDKPLRHALGLVWACNVQGTDSVREMSKFLTGAEIQDRVDCLTRDGLLDGDARVTRKGRAELTVVMCGGVFDIIHHGHTHALTAAKSMGDVLVVVVASDGTVKKAKKAVRHDACTRRRIVGSLGMVDACIVGDDTDIFASVRAIRPDIIALGYDQTHSVARMEESCRRMGLPTNVVRLDSPVPDVSSTALKKAVRMDVM